MRPTTVRPAWMRSPAMRSAAGARGNFRRSRASRQRAVRRVLAGGSHPQAGHERSRHLRPSLDRRPQRATVHCDGRGRVEIVEHRREHIGETHLLLVTLWTLAGGRARRHDEQRDAQDLVVEALAVTAIAVLEELLAMVGHDDD